MKVPASLREPSVPMFSMSCVSPAWGRIWVHLLLVSTWTLSYRHLLHLTMPSCPPDFSLWWAMVSEQSLSQDYMPTTLSIPLHSKKQLSCPRRKIKQFEGATSPFYCVFKKLSLTPLEKVVLARVHWPDSLIRWQCGRVGIMGVQRRWIFNPFIFSKIFPLIVWMEF